jgi:hypothetical protein
VIKEGSTYHVALLSETIQFFFLSGGSFNASERGSVLSFRYDGFVDFLVELLREFTSHSTRKSTPLGKNV